MLRVQRRDRRRRCRTNKETLVSHKNTKNNKTDMCVFHQCIRSLTISDSVYSSRCLLAARFSSNFISLFLQYKSANKSSYHPKLQLKKKLSLSIRGSITSACHCITTYRLVWTKPNTLLFVQTPRCHQRKMDGGWVIICPAVINTLWSHSCCWRAWLLPGDLSQHARLIVDSVHLWGNLLSAP